MYMPSRQAKRQGSLITFNREEILWQMIQGPGDSPPVKQMNAPKGEIVSVCVHHHLCHTVSHM